MNKFLVAFALAAAIATPAHALCVSERDIVNTTPSDDGKMLTLHLRDGRVLVNHLHGVCNDLRFNGFVWVLRGNNDICENAQTIRVLQSGQTCLLGKFDAATKPAPKVP
jgi:hypothetical protein